MIPMERRFIQLLGVAGGIILLHQVLDLYSASTGMDLSTASGRIRLMTLVWSRAPALLAADVCLVVAATLSGARPLIRALAVAHTIAALAAAVGLPVFLVAAGRLAGSLGGTELLAFRITVVRVLVGLAALTAGTYIVGSSLRRFPSSPQAV